MTRATIWRRGAPPAAVVAVALTAACGGGGDGVAGGAAAEPSVAASAAGEPTPSAAPVDLAAFVPLDRAAWTAIDRSPGDAAGQQVVVYAVVTQVYVSASGTYAAAIATSQPAAAAEGTPAILRGDPDEVGPVAPGDVLLAHAEVTGAYDGPAGGSVLLPELRLMATEPVAAYDLAADVTLGAPVWGTASVTVPVTARNSADTTMDYRVDVVALSADGAAQVGSTQARFGFLEPGQAATVEVRMPVVPPDAQITVTAVARSLPPPA